MTFKPINLLLVDDDMADRRMIMKSLAEFSHSVQFNIETAATLAEVTERLGSNKYDIVLLDLSLPDSSGIDTIQKLHNINSNIPIV
ncbi:unnamed protein product, partial [marine sediment metagenome]